MITWFIVPGVCGLKGMSLAFCRVIGCCSFGNCTACSWGLFIGDVSRVVNIVFLVMKLFIGTITLQLLFDFKLYRYLKACTCILVNLVQSNI